MQFSKLTVLATTFVASASAYTSNSRSFAVNHFYGKGPLVMGRVDPIVSPGVPAGHVHAVQGGNNFAMTMSDTQALESTCTSSLVKNDKSNYWTPSLYFHADNGSFIAVPMFYMNVYYFFEATNDKIQAFQPGHRMLVGNPGLRTPPPAGGRAIIDLADGTPQPVQWTCPRSNPSAPLYPVNSDGLHGAGIQDPNNKGSGVGFPDQNCDGYASPLRADIHFPSCYDPSKGIHDYENNMQFPTNGNCPSGWIHTPHLFYEVYWNTPVFADLWTPGQGKQPFVLSNGDPTGYGLHGDFISGWDVNTLQQIIDHCDAGDAGMDKCPGLIGGLNDPGNSCNIQSPVNEVINGVMQNLPGNNLLGQWGVQGAAPAPAPHPPTSSKPAPTAPGAGGSTPPKSSTAGAGAGAGAGSGSGGYPTKPTTTQPAKQQSAPPKSGQSTSKAPANPAPAPTNAPHGGNNGHSNTIITSYVSETTVIYTTVTAAGPSPSSVVAEGWSYKGCYTDKKGSGQRVLSGITFANVGQHAVSNTKCVAYCANAGFTMAGTEYGGQCFCGNELVGSSKADESQCNVPCEGDGSQTCGGSLTLSVYKTSGAKRRSLHLHRHLHGRSPF